MKTITGHVEGSTIALDEMLELSPGSRLKITVVPDDNAKLESETKLEQMMSSRTDRLYLSEAVLPLKSSMQNTFRTEHTYAVYTFIGRGFTQEIDWLRLGKEEQFQWKRKIFTEFLDDMAQQGWTLVSSASLDSEYAEHDYISYFRREVEAVSVDDLSIRKDLESSLI